MSFSHGYPFQILYIEFLEGLPAQDGNSAVIGAIDGFSKWIEAAPVQDLTAIAAARFVFTEIICRHGIPKFIIFDRGSAFISELFAELNTLLGIKVFKRFWRYLAAGISIFCKSQRPWTILLPALLFAYRTSALSSIGLSPFQILHGVEPRLPTDQLFNSTLPSKYSEYVKQVQESIKHAHEIVVRLQREASEITLRILNSKQNELEFSVGSWIILWTPISSYKVKKEGGNV